MTPSEAGKLAAVVLDRLAPHLPEAASAGGPGPAGPLYELVAARLRALGEAEALADLVREPRNNSLVKRLLRTAATEDPGYAAELAAAVGALPAAAAAPVVADRPATPAEPREPVGAVPGSGGGRRPRRYGPWVALGAVVLLLAVGGLVVRAVLGGLSEAGGLTADSSCEEYQQAPPEERVAAIRQIGLAKGISGVDSPLVMTAVDQLCDAQPTARIGDLIARFDG
ncbi:MULTISPECIES: hypothetical protein [unclassified Plantactinospora]|uniref:hypothetical protein n=1 Tax=unclassified Plantactinospora TaxID=2631981 RepID=UPI000D163735|nr:MULTISPECIES: hypothetical protein [unclassified Plantactinospora]AVT31599.1 hypothetical protein C6361_21335 [Plantactinospora sp. BC1]AVT38733.1 hypothetical protein C6W10_22415 [Plantactinospora sp. BB1]